MDIQSIKNRFGIIGNAPALNYAMQVASQVAATDLTVLFHRSFIPYQLVNTILSLQLTAAPFQKEQSILNYLVTKKDHSQVLPKRERVTLKRSMAAPFF